MDSQPGDVFDQGLDDGAPRHTKRDSLLLSARMAVAGLREPLQVRVRNVSAGGLMAEVAKRLDVGAAIEIDLRGIGVVTGRVAWWTDGRCGIAFDAPIDPQATRKPVGQGAKTPVYAKPILPLL